MKWVSLILLLLFQNILFAQKIKIRTYEHPNLKQFVAEHKKVAILPCRVKIGGDTQKSEGEQLMNRQTEIREGFNLQSTCLVLLRERAAEYSAYWMETDKNNLLLPKHAYLDVEVLPTDTIIAIAKKLQADAVVRVAVRQQEEFYDANKWGTRQNSEFAVDVAFSIYDGKTGELVWQGEDSSYYTFKHDYNESIDHAVQFLLQRIRLKLPYKIKPQKSKKEK